MGELIYRCEHSDVNLDWSWRGDSDVATEGFTAVRRDVTLRRQLIELLSNAPRSVSSLAREMGLRRNDAEEELRHALRSATAAGHRIQVMPARCKDCGFVFSDDRLTKPGRCPSCKGSRLFEPQICLS